MLRSKVKAIFRVKCHKNPIFCQFGGLGVIGCNIVDVKCHMSYSNVLLTQKNNYVHTKTFICIIYLGQRSKSMSQKFHFCHFGGYKLYCCGYETCITHVIIFYYLMHLSLWIPPTPLGHYPGILTHFSVISQNSPHIFQCLCQNLVKLPFIFF